MRYQKRDSKPGKSSGAFHSRRRDTGRPVLHKVKCDDCGSMCEVPFKPTGDKPIYCDNCYHKSNNRKDGKRYEGNSFETRHKEKYEALCDSCGEKCEVPFQPKGDKAIFCDKCFSAHRPLGGSQYTQPEDKLDMINAKLDKILNILNPPVPLKTLRERRLQKGEEQEIEQNTDEVLK